MQFTEEEIISFVYINQGPLLDTIDTKKLFANKLGIPLGMEIHSSINGMYRYGWVMFDDRSGVRETLPLTGNEILSLGYKNKIRQDNLTLSDKVIHFNIVDIEEVQIYKTDKENRFSDKLLKFHVVECPLFLKYNTECWTRSYGKHTGTLKDGVQGMAIDQIFLKHLQSDLKISEDIFTFNFQKMGSKIHFCNPAWKSQAMFNYLLDYAKDEDGYSNVKFYPTSDLKTGKVILNLRSVNKMFVEKKVVEFTLVNSQPFQKFQAGSIEFGQKNLNTVLTYKFLSYDLTTLAAGYGGVRMLNIDYLNSKYFTQQDNYKNLIKKEKSPYFSNFGLWSDTVSTERSKQVYRGEQPKDLAVNYLTNAMTDYQHQLRCEITTYLDETVDVGDKVFIMFPSSYVLATGDEIQGFDEQMSGGWIVEEIVDASMHGKCVRKMTIMKDSYFNIIEPVKGTRKQTLPTVKPLIK